MKIRINEGKLMEVLSELEWNKKTLAERMGVPYVTVYRVLKGQRNPGNEFIARLLNVCKGYGFDDLFILDDPLPKGIVQRG